MQSLNIENNCIENHHNNEYTDIEKQYYLYNYLNTVYNVEPLYILNSIKDVLIIGLILVGGFGLTFTCLGLMYKNMRDDFPDDFKDYEAYEDCYDNEFNELESHELTTEEIELLKKKHATTKTPKGTIIMYYNFETETFCYYCENKKAIPYSYLETVAKLFILENDCKILFKEDDVTEENNSKKEISSNKRQKLSNQKQENIEEEENIFANLKNYNKVIKSNPKETTFEAKDKLKKITNHYKYLGKLDDYSENIINISYKSSSENETENETDNETEPETKDKKDETETQDKKDETETQDKKDEPETKDKKDEEFIKINKDDITTPPPPLPNKPKKLKKDSKIKPRKDLTFAEYKKQVLEPNHKK